MLIGIAIATLALSAAFAQQGVNKGPKPEYRVISLEDLFKGDDEALTRLKEGSLNSAFSDGSEYQIRVGVRRTDMDAQDYEKALNRMAADGWMFEGLTKSNCWIFSKK